MPFAARLRVVATGGELRRRGHRVRLDLRVPWEHSHDRFIDTPPYRWDPAHLKLSAEGSVTSSFGLVVRRGR